MQDVLTGVLAAVLLLLAIYAQRNIPRFTRGKAKVVLSRAALIGIGIAFGLTLSASLQGAMAPLLALLLGFGAVHAPAAIILFIKAARHEGKS